VSEEVMSNSQTGLQLNVSDEVITDNLQPKVSEEVMSNSQTSL
jgi:hypothetical protein